jgi:hypothetical protein
MLLDFINTSTILRSWLIRTSLDHFTVWQLSYAAKRVFLWVSNRLTLYIYVRLSYTVTLFHSAARAAA